MQLSEASSCKQERFWCFDEDGSPIVALSESGLSGTAAGLSSAELRCRKKFMWSETRSWHCHVFCSHTVTMKTTWKEVSMEQSLSLEVTDTIRLHRLRPCRPRKSSSILSSVELSDDCPHKFVLDSRLAELEVGSDYWTE